MDGIRQFKSSFLFSLLLHLFLLGFLIVLAPRFENRFEQPEPLWIELEPIVKNNPKTDESFKKQIVQSKTGEIVKEAPKDAYLGEKNRRVDRETISQDQIGESNPEHRASKVIPQPRGGHQEIPALGNLGVPLITGNSGSLLQKEEDSRNWNDQAGQFNKVKPGDYIKGLKEGESTALNTKEFVYFSYFERIRKQLDQSWRPTLQKSLEKLFYAGRSLASDMDHTTKVLVTLDVRGEIVRVQVLEESGTRDLDKAAIQAFNDAGPFPNPPTGLADKDGKIEIRWDFILKT